MYARSHECGRLQTSQCVNRDLDSALPPTQAGTPPRPVDDSKMMHFAYCSSDSFFGEIRAHLDRGGGIVPLLGAGVSVASSIATGGAIRSLVADCLLRAAWGGAKCGRAT